MRLVPLVSTLLPALWPILAGCGSATHEECVGISTLECDDTEGCTLVRAEPLRKLAEDRWCLQTVALAENVGCRGVELACDDARTLAEDASGRQWRFRSTCLPEGFTALPGKTEPCGF